MTMPTIENVSIKMLVLNEDKATRGELVVVTLAKSIPVTGTGYFLGDMKYQGHPIDMVSANFSDDEGEAGEPGKVGLEIALQDGNTFVEPFVTVTPSAEVISDLHCIEISEDRPGSSILDITFIEPEKDEAIAYPVLYFHTARGVIDPGIVIKRKPD